MRLLVCGKGGAGKSTVTALLARTLAANGRRVAVLDTDTSNVSLHRLLGTAAPPDLTRFFADAPGLRRILEEARRKGIPPGEPLLGRWTFDTLPEGYACARDGVALLRAGKIADATQYGKGRLVAIARQFLAGLAHGDNDRTLVDADAGIELLVRGLAGSCDALLAVVDPTPDGAALAGHAARIVAPAGVPTFAVLNGVDAATADALRADLPPGLRVIGEIPRDPAILAAGLEGRVLPADHPAVAALAGELERLRAAGFARD